MQAIIDVYRMEEVRSEVRIKIIKKLGKAINYEYGSNVTDDLVNELVILIDHKDNGDRINEKEQNHLRR